METNPYIKVAAPDSAETMNTQTHTHPQPIISFSILWQRCLELARQGRQEELRAMLQRHGVEKLTELPKEKYEEVLMEVEKW